MLRIQELPRLADRLSISEPDLIALVDDLRDNPETRFRKLHLYDPAKPNKRPREVLSMRKQLRKIQWRLYRRLLLPRLDWFPHSHGGVPGRHIKTNAEPHADSAYVFTADISNFFPSVSYNRIYRLFNETFGCSPDVSRCCTRLCTYDHHLALGLITSPLLADQVLRPLDDRIAGACREVGLTYTRFVDDITLSGPFDLRKNPGIPRLIGRIIAKHGFEIHPDKGNFGRLVDGIAITGVRVKKGRRFDVTKEYIDNLLRQMDDATRLAHDGSSRGPYYTRDQIHGRLQFACWINPGRRSYLMRRFKSIPWRKVERVAKQRGLFTTTTRLVVST